MKIHPENRFVRLRGFTLVETVIAMGIITVMITAFLAAFGPARLGIKQSISAKDAVRLTSTLESELATLRPGQASQSGTAYSSAFHKAYDWVENSVGGTSDEYILVYQYRGDPDSVRADGSLNPYTDSEGIPGQDYVIQSMARQLGDAATEAELQPSVVVGDVFLVRMRQLVFDAAGDLVITTTPGEIVDPSPPIVPTTSHVDYPEAVIAFEAQFYALQSSLYDYVSGASFNLEDQNGDGHPDATGRPVLTRKLAVRR